MSEKKDNIELRSEKVRSIIGQIPSRIIRSGIVVIFIIVIILLTGSYFFHYPDKVEGTAYLLEHSDTSHQYYTQIQLRYRFIGKIKQQQKVSIELEGYPVSNFGLLKGKVIKIFPVPIEINGQSYFIIKAKLDNGMITSQNKNIPYYLNLKGNAKIIVGEHRLIAKLLSPITSILKEE